MNVYQTRRLTIGLSCFCYGTGQNAWFQLPDREPSERTTAGGQNFEELGFRVTLC